MRGHLAEAGLSPVNVQLTEMKQKRWETVSRIRLNVS